MSKIASFDGPFLKFVLQRVAVEFLATNFNEITVPECMPSELIILTQTSQVAVAKVDNTRTETLQSSRLSKNMREQAINVKHEQSQDSIMHQGTYQQGFIHQRLNTPNLAKFLKFFSFSSKGRNQQVGEVVCLRICGYQSSSCSYKKQDSLKNIRVH
ncbi:hypothetical protein FGO68_gene4450 [Halteria grandinella]|uniref:Uncharacterized protein n=1 Tax=Halteria grandinella TaxID=5974 RepID=A0A8J8NLP1_HALGN|nr:hypothetical protein FGO68_gene4450 [Halteria grandinella]